MILEAFLLSLSDYPFQCSLILRIILCLCIPQLVVFTVCISNEACMRALLDNGTLMEHSDLIAELATG